MVLRKKVIGSQRALQFGGKGILDKNERIYNCSSGHIDRPRAFQEAMFLLLCGVGVGFSTQYCHINKLPTISKRTKNKKTYVIPDSVEGWADAVGVLMSSYFTKDQPFPEYAGHEIEFDFSLIRPKGSLISWGGIAPGPDGLNNSLQKIAKVIERRLSKENTTEILLQPIDAYDIIMHISDAVLSGGIRRCLPEYYSIKMADGSYKKINEIEVGDEISFLGNSYPVTNIFDNGIQELVKINTTEGYHISTPNHRWLVYNTETKSPEWIEAEKISPDIHKFMKEKHK
jgi:hypothetical protein